ncbi:hypothetical protein DPMN_159320 [Dreissena polymorpha]|uniref:Uncharacterized protein n=1 Tax=Dreissena polymorpha TaxID=45954 RepID=A0A9D4IP31_DREPO|nr:hypothetical protein DPMN_159320 [Dreissena polymorpha]
MLLKLQMYDYDIVYKKGEHMYISNTLSRAYYGHGSTKLDDVLLSEYEKEIESTKMTDYPCAFSRKTRQSTQENTSRPDLKNRD